jgi:hypothetical protein
MLIMHIDYLESQAKLQMILADSSRTDSAGCLEPISTDLTRPGWDKSTCLLSLCCDKIERHLML